VNRAILVSVRKVVQVAVRLTPAIVQQQLTVSEHPPPSDTTQTTEATTLDHEESPVVSRNHLDFVLFGSPLSVGCPALVRCRTFKMRRRSYCLQVLSGRSLLDEKSWRLMDQEGDKFEF
jgi:hypothetical protein